MPGRRIDVDADRLARRLERTGDEPPEELLAPTAIYARKLLAMMRAGFGGHPVQRK